MFKWVINQPDSFGPRKELAVLIPRHYPQDDALYYLESSKRVVPQTDVFDSAIEAANACIELDRKRIRALEADCARLAEWIKELEANSTTNKESEERHL